MISGSRKDFEKCFSVPKGVFWNDACEQYDSLPGTEGFAEVEIYHGKWMGWHASRQETDEFSSDYIEPQGACLNSYKNHFDPKLDLNGDFDLAFWLSHETEALITHMFRCGQNWKHEVYRKELLQSIIEFQNKAFVVGQQRPHLTLPDDIDRRRTMKSKWDFFCQNEDRVDENKLMEGLSKDFYSYSFDKVHSPYPHDPETHLSRLSWSRGVVGYVEYACAVLRRIFGYNVRPYHEIGAKFDTKYSGVYVLIKDQEIIYVGQARNIFQRIKAHQEKNFDYFIPIKASAADMDLCEGAFVRYFKPRLNRAKPPKADIPDREWEEIMSEMEDMD